MVHVNLSFAAVVVVQSSCLVWLFATPWTAARHASMPLIISQSLPKFMFIISMILSSHLILLCPLLLLPSIFPSIKDFSNKSSLLIRWPKYCSFSFWISPSVNNQGWSPLRLTGLISLLSKGLSGVLQHHSSKTSILQYSAFFKV